MENFLRERPDLLVRDEFGQRLEEFEEHLPRVALRVIQEAPICSSPIAAQLVLDFPPWHRPYPIFSFSKLGRYDEFDPIQHPRLRQLRDAAMVQLVEVEDEHFQNRHVGEEEEDEDFTDTGE